MMDDSIDDRSDRSEIFAKNDWITLILVPIGLLFGYSRKGI